MRTQFLVWLICALATTAALAQEAGAEGSDQANAENVAALDIDGKPLFILRGISSYPAAKRVALVRERIIAAAPPPRRAGSRVRCKNR